MLNKIYIFEPKFNFMKKLHYFLLCLLTITLINCSRDNNETPLNIENLKGTWMPIASSIDGTAIVNGISTKIKTDVPLSDCERKGKVVFGKEDKGEMILWATQIDGVCQEVMNGDFTYFYNSTDKSVTVNYGNKLEKSFIIKLTDKELITDQHVENQEIPTAQNARFTGKVRMIYKKAN